MKISHPLVTKRLILNSLQCQDAEGDYKNWVRDPIVNKYLELRHNIPDMENLKSFIKN